MAITTTAGDAIAVVEPPAAAVLTNMQPMQVEEPPQLPRSHLATWVILMALYLSEFIAAIDTTITATSVPVISAALHSSSGYLWIGGAYMLADAAGAPIWQRLERVMSDMHRVDTSNIIRTACKLSLAVRITWSAIIAHCEKHKLTVLQLSDIWGRKVALIGAVLLFSIGSVLSGASVSMGMLIAGRAVQGAAGGGIMSMVSITISDLFSVRERSMYLGITDFVWAGAGAVGPVMGGVFTELVSWRWCFYINLPICALSLIIIVFFLKVHNPRTPLRSGILAVDWFGIFSILAVALMILLGLDFGGAVYPWTSPKVICLITLGVASIGLFVFSEKKLAKYPLMPLGIFKNRSTVAAFAVVSCHGISQRGTEFYVPLYFQSVRGASPLRSGILILPLIILTASGSALSGFTIHRTGRYREIILGGMLLLTLGLGLYIQLDIHTKLGEIIVFEILEGFGAGLVFQPPLVAVQAVVRQADAASATATLSFMRNIASSLGLVLGGVVFQNGMDSQLPYLRAAGLNDTQISAFSSSNAAASVEIIRTLPSKLQQEAVRQAYSWSLRNTWITFTAFAGLGLVLSIFIQYRDLSKDHTETVTGIDGMSKRDT